MPPSHAEYARRLANQRALSRADKSSVGADEWLAGRRRSAAARRTGTAEQRALLSLRAPRKKRSLSISSIGPRMPDTDGACREGPLGYDKGDLVRVLVQTLGEHGFARSAAALAEESKVPVEAEETALFRRSILDGQYDTALAILPALDPTLPEGMLRSLRFAIERERYLELLESRRIKEALVCLRTAVTPNAADAAHVHLLAGLITQSHPDEVRRRAAWRGAGPESRNALLATIQDLLPPALMLRSRRLEELLAQAFHYQLQQCPLHFHAESRPFNGLFSDHRCDDGAVAFRPKAHLSCHTDEAWFLAFSHDGRLLAAASKDHTVSVWGSENGSLVRLLSEHTAGVTHLAWSPDDQYLLTCSKDYRARVWRVADGECVRIFLLSSECNVGIWTDGGAAVVIASEDGILTKLSRDGTTFVKKALRCRDLVALDSERVLALGHEKTVYTISPADLSFKASFSESSVLSSLAPSRDRRTVLLTTLAPGEVCLWRLGPEKPQILRSYAGHANERFLVRACFARPDESIIVTGSEDGDVCLYHKDSARLIQTLKGHRGAVNCVAWTDAHSGVLASAGDDGTIILWSSAGAA